MIVDGRLEPMELGHLPYRKATYEHYVGIRGLKRMGKKRWRYIEDLSITDTRTGEHHRAPGVVIEHRGTERNRDAQQVTHVGRGVQQRQHLSVRLFCAEHS